jgi:hypothetical protein
MDEMEQMYLDLIQPKKLIEYFLDEQDFREWLRMGGVEEMGWALRAFEREELYNHCKIIKEEIENAE